MGLTGKRDLQVNKVQLVDKDHQEQMATLENPENKENLEYRVLEVKRAKLVYQDHEA